MATTPQKYGSAGIYFALPPDYHNAWLSNQLFELWNVLALTHCGPSKMPDKPHILHLYSLTLPGSGCKCQRHEITCSYDTSTRIFDVDGSRYTAWEDALNHLWNAGDKREVM